MDYTQINKQLKSLKPDDKLPEAVALDYLSVLLRALNTQPVASTPSAVNNLIVLTKVLDFVPKSDEIFAKFDDNLFRTLMELACSKELSNEVLRGVLRVGLTYLAGVLPKTRKRGMFNIILGVICEPMNSTLPLFNQKLRCDILFKNLSEKIDPADARMNLNIVDFVAKILYRLIESINGLSEKNSSNNLTVEETWMIQVVRALYISDFFGKLCVVSGVDEIEGMTGLRGSMTMVRKWLESKSVLNGTQLWNEFIFACKQVGLNISTNKNINTMVIISILGALNSPKKSLSKTIIECSLSEPFPIVEFSNELFEIIKVNNNLKPLFNLWNTELWYTLINIGAHCWLLSGATIKDNDTLKVVQMVGAIINWIGEKLTNCKSNEEFLIIFEDALKLEYHEIRDLQLKQVRQKSLDSWSNDLKPFKTMINEQVSSFVKNQRYLELSKGSWVYSSNPLDGTKSWYFVTLSSNSNALLYKEFTKRMGKSKYAGTATATTTPNIDKDGVIIELKNITNIQCEDLSTVESNKNLISLTSKRMTVNKISVISNKGIFTFYTNTEQLRNVWVDGLRLLMGQTGSDEVENEIFKLQDIAIRTQMLSLDIENSPQVGDVTDFDGLSSNFYYN